MRKKILYLLLIIGCCTPACAQDPFENEIKEFQREDSISPPPKKAILFIGSSSFRMWEKVKDDFPKHTIINRGFGGSSLEDVFRYKEQIIYPYEPAQVVIYCGENDVASGVSGEQAFERFRKLFLDLRSRLPNSSIVFVSMKPSPSRKAFFKEVEKGNTMIKNFLVKQKLTHFVDVFKPMLDQKGKPKGELFLADSLHMNEKGYAIWKKAIEPVLKK
jgi:lysophospholipase L1-like esterase